MRMLFSNKKILKKVVKNYAVMGNYSINPTNPHVNWVYIAHKYLNRIMDELKIMAKNLKKALKRDLGYNVSDSQCSRAKKKSIKIIEGTYMKQY